MKKKGTGKLKSQIIKSFLLILLPVFLLIILTVELLLVPSAIETTKNELINSTRTVKTAIEASADVAIRNHLKAVAERNLEICRYHFSLVEQGLITRDEAKRRLEQIIRSQKVGSSGYVYCLNSAGVIVVHPNKELLFSNVSKYEFVRYQIKNQTGYLEYNWKNPGEATERPKALYMVYFEPFDWIISASSYREEFDELLDPGDFRKMVLSITIGKSGYAYVVGKDGQALIHPKFEYANILSQTENPSDFFHEMTSKGNGIVVYDWKNPGELISRKKMAAYATLPQYGWIIVSTAYLQEILHPAWVARWVAYGTTLALLLLTVVFAYILSGKIVKPVDRMIEQLDENARDGSLSPLPVTGNNELARLAGELNRYLQTIDVQTTTLHRQRTQYRELFEASPDAIFILSGLTITACNPATYELFDGESETILGKTVAELSPFFQSDGQESSFKAMEKIRTAQKTRLLEFEWEHCTVHGEIFDAEVRLRPFGSDDNGNPLVLAFLRNITERKASENALKKSELKYRQLLENASDAVFIAQDGKMVFINDKTLDIVGKSRRELMARPFTDFIHPDDVKMVVERHMKRLRGEEGLPNDYAFRILTRDDEELDVALSTVLIEWNGMPATLNFLRDISQHVKLQKALQQAKKMEAIGTLAGGIAHDFNNLLMGIQGRLSLLHKSRQVRSAEQKQFDEIFDYIKSASGLTKQLLGVARGGKYDPKPVDLVSFCAKSMEMFARTKKEIEMNFEGPENQIIVEVDASQIEQVLLNIFMNGWQAMPEGGKMMVTVSQKELNPDFCQAHDVEAGPFASLSISDTGCGIEPAVLEKIFDPFFTTKGQARGTGLGLASVYGIVKNHKGIITVNSEVGRGTEFIIYLPLSENKVEVEEKTDLDSAVIEGNATVLLIDDEAMILDVGSGLLQALGYKVYQAKGGLQALELLKEHGEEIDLIILDLIMPEMDGSKTYEEIRALNQAVPVMLSSGYSKDDETEKLLKKGCSDFIQKPFTIEKLSQKVHRILR